MSQTLKKNLWSVICTFWSLVIALFWFAMRVNWSGISKVLCEAIGASEPSAFLLDLPMYISVFLWIVFAFAAASLLFLKERKTVV